MVKKSLTIKGTKIELDEEEALNLITKIQGKFGWFGATITKDDVEENSMSNERPNDGMWEKIEEDFYEEVQRFVESL